MSDQPSRSPRPSPGRRITPLRVLAGVVVVGSFLLWAYAFSGLARRDAPDTLDDASFAADAEPICAAAVADIDQLPPAMNFGDDPEGRADVLDRATDRLAAMVADLETVATGTDRDRRIVDAWLSDWRTYLSDRRRFAEVIRVDEDEPFQLTAREGRAITAPMNRMATVNDMPSCTTPGDV
ncbi:MAG: hypothetical protein S0880_34960 [Actinomycetota bacterium]|nr:hypothetical protein [Actinomycetota bacterium]